MKANQVLEQEAPTALVDGVPNAEEAIAYALKRWGYRQGTKECVAFYRGACWLQLASQPLPGRTAMSEQTSALHLARSRILDLEAALRNLTNAFHEGRAGAMQREAQGYIDSLVHAAEYALARSVLNKENGSVETSPAPSNKELPVLLFDGYYVYAEGLTDDARRRTSPENVADVLDAVVRLIRADGVPKENDRA